MTGKRTFAAMSCTAVLCVALAAADANAQCCGSPAVAQPVAYQAFSPVVSQPVAYQTYRPFVMQTARPVTGWYPGYWLDRIRTSLWGAPRTVVVAQPTAVAQPTYSVGYAPTTTYMPTSTVSQTTLRPVYTTSYSTSVATACDPCTSCPTTVSQAVYQQPADCIGCEVVQPAAGPAPQTYDPGRAPQIAPDEQVSPERVERPVTNGNESHTSPNGDGSDDEPADDGMDSVLNSDSTYFEAPALFDPNGRTARHTAPVWTAVYQRPASDHQVQARPISRQQAQQDAAGWVSASQ